MDFSSDLSDPPSSSDPSSSGLSSACSSPTLPYDYASPISSQDVSNDSGSQTSSRKRSPDGIETPPETKRRKVMPKPRMTKYLNLNLPPYDSTSDHSEGLAILTKLLRKRRKIVVIAGAGISTSAGIPDFRSKAGLFTTLKNDHNLKTSGKQLFDASVYQTDEGTAQFHTMVRSLSQRASAAKPTAFHHLLASLANKGQLMRLYTQNVDGIDTSLPPLHTAVPLSTKGPWPRTIQLHGGLERMVCSKCHIISEFKPTIFDGPTAPECSNCIENDRVRLTLGGRSHGIGRLRPRIVLYNEHNPDDDAIGAVMTADLRARPDAVIVVGTSMKIPGVRRFVREMCGVVRGRKDGIAVWLNQGPPPPGKEFEDSWDLVIEGNCDSVAEHAAMKRWDDTSIDYEETTESDAERAKRDGEVRVVVHPTPDGVVRTALLTPAPSPKPREKASGKVLFSLENFKDHDRGGKTKVQSKKQRQRRPAKPKTKAKVSTNGGIKQSFKTAKANQFPAGQKPTSNALPKPFADPQSPPLPALHPPSVNSDNSRGFVNIPPSLHSDLDIYCRNKRITPPRSIQADSPPPQLSPNTKFTNLRELPDLSSIPSSRRSSYPAEKSSSPLSSPPSQAITPPEHRVIRSGFRRVRSPPLQSNEARTSPSPRALRSVEQDLHSTHPHHLASVRVPIDDSPCNQAPKPLSPFLPAQKIQLASRQPTAIHSADHATRFSPDQNHRPTYPMVQVSPQSPKRVNRLDHPSLFSLIPSCHTPSTPSRKSSSSSFRRCSTPERRIIHKSASPITPAYSVITAYRPKEQWHENQPQQCLTSPTPCFKTRWLPSSTPERHVLKELATPQWSIHSGYISPSSSSRFDGYQQSREQSSSPSPSPSPSPLLRHKSPFNRSFRRDLTPERYPFESRVYEPPDWSPISSHDSSKQFIQVIPSKELADNNEDIEKRRTSASVPSHHSIFELPHTPLWNMPQGIARQYTSS